MLNSLLVKPGSMSNTHGGHLRILVADGHPSFTTAVREAFAGMDRQVTVETVTTADGVTTRVSTDGASFDGIILGDTLASPLAVIDRVNEEEECPVFLTTDGNGDASTIAAAVEAGITDVYPRTTARPQYELIAESLVADHRGTETASLNGHTEVTGVGGRQDYRELFENVSDGLVVHDPETGEILDVNQQFCDLHGYRRDELLGRTIDVITAPDDRYSLDSAQERINQAADHGSELFEWQNQHKNGETFPVEVHLAVVQLGGTERVLASVRDITERKRREREFEQIFNGVQDSITVHDPDTAELLDVNETFCELLGYDRETILDMGIEGYSPPDQDYTMEQARAFVSEVIESDEPKETEWAVETSEGEIRWLEVKGTTVEIGGELRYVSIDRDITERKHQERERRLAETRFDIVTRNLDESIFIAKGPQPRSDGGADSTYALSRWEFEYLTPAVEQALNRSREDVYEDPTLLMELLVPEDRPVYDDWLRNVSAAIDTGDIQDAYTVEYRVRNTDGEIRWMQTSAYPAPIDSEELVRLVGITEDITERRERQQRLEAERDRRSVLFENTPDPIMTVTFENGQPHITEANPAFEEVFGFDADAVADRPLAETLVPEDERDQFERLRQRAARGESFEAEARRKTTAGEREFVFRVLPFDDQGTQRAYVWYTDVTEQRRRERMIESLHDATERLQQAATTEEACQTTVQAARDVLGLPSTACWLHRDTDAGPELEPVAATDPVRAIDPASFHPGDIEYDAFEDGEVLHYDPSEHFPDNPLDAAIMLPLGEHGLLGVGKRGVEAYDEFVVDAARTLAGHVRTALDRVVRAEQLRENERRLSAILDRIDEAIYLAPVSVVTEPDPATDFVSAGYEDVFGLSLAEMHETYEEGFFGVLHPDESADYRTFVERIQTDLTSGDAQDRYAREYRIELPDGDVRWIHSDFYPTEWHDDEYNIVVASRDVTRRKERERTLESFHDATAALTTTDTIEEVGEIAVQAATDVFGISATAIYTYEEESGELMPVATGCDIDATLSSIGATDDPAWSAFVDERMQRVPTAEVDVLDAGQSVDPLLVPLGRNGLLVVWHSAEELDADTATIIAATVEAALNRLRGERRVESRSEELEAQVERARRLEALTELTQRVEAAITAETSRQGIEETICEELTDLDLFEAAWIAEADVGTDRLSPRAVAGIDRDTVETALMRADPDTDPHPAVEAWQTGDLAAVNDLVGGRRDGWRRTLLGRGAGAICAVPLSYSGVTYGVLAIVADETGVFGDREREALTQLGTSIGHAITAIERQRALESDDTVELEFQGEDSTLSVAQLAREAGCTVRHERTVRRQDGSVSIYYTLTGDPPDNIVAAATQTLPGTIDTVTRDDQQIMIERQGSSWFGELISEYGGVVRHGEASPTGVTLTIELPQETDTRTVVKQVYETFPGLELTAQRQHRETAPTTQEIVSQLEQRLTDRQYEALATAHAMGYFEWPRESSGEDVANALDITQPTVNKHLRYGKQKVFELLFESDTADATG